MRKFLIIKIPRLIMKIKYLQNASVIIENQGEKILCDPWLIDGCYYGSWNHYPKFEFNEKEFEDIDLIYLSHIHPDHFDKETLKKLDKDIPVYIHNFPEKFFKNNIEQIGFKVIELENNKRTKLGSTWINVIAADNCNPEICNRVFGCSFEQANFGTNQIDTMVVFDNDEQVIVNVNDCPFEIGGFTAQMVKEQYNRINLLLVGYSGASDYPLCYDFDLTTKNNESIMKKTKRLQDAKNYINIFEPEFYLPFAGRYVLGGRKYSQLQFKGEPSLDEAFIWLKNNINKKNTGILLNSKSSFNIDTGKTSDEYIPEDIFEKENYVNTVLFNKKFDYEFDDEPDIKEIFDLIPKCFEKFERKRQQINYSTEIVIILEINSEYVVKIPMNGNKIQIIKKIDFEYPEKFLSVKMNIKLLKRILKGPRFAHWNNASIGCHIEWKRQPNFYDRALMYCLNFLHL